MQRNLGHPSLQAFVRTLRHAGAKKEVVEWTKGHFKCPFGEKLEPPTHRPGHLQKVMNSNEVVGIDLIQINVRCGRLCHGELEPVANKQANTILFKFSRSLLAHYGPSVFFADQGNTSLTH